jgi:hypothetical protein
MKLTVNQQWRKTIAWLKRNFPAQRPVYVKSKSIKKFHGLTDLITGYFLIEISRKQSYELRVDALLHEWAHCLTWFSAEETAEHSAEWGIDYAKIIRTFEEWNYGTEKKVRKRSLARKSSTQ